MNHSYPTILLGLAVVLVGSRAAAESEPGQEAEQEKSIELDVDVGISSAYVWRGYNLFQDTKQMDQNAMVAPAFTLAFPQAGVSVGYWGAFQLNGENKSALVDAGLGAEQDIIVGYERSLSEKLTVSFGLTYYFYPLADEKIAGTSVPSYLEPSAGVTYATFADLGLTVAYYHGVQEELKGSRHLYLNPSVTRTFELSANVGLEPLLGFGYKLFNESDVEDNVYDVLLSVGVPIVATDSISVTPSVNAAWTNLSDVPLGNGAVEERGFGDEYVVWGGLNLGYSAL